jgi:RNA polymerase sigma factor (sigma-70 family)
MSALFSMNENEVFIAYRDATGEEKNRLETELIHLLRRHAKALVYLKLKTHREDLVNYAVWLAIRDHKDFEGRNGAKFSTWFYHIVMNVCNTALRGKQRQREVPFDDILEPSVDTIHAMDSQMELDRLFGDHLSEEENALVRLRLAGADSEEIADALGVAPATVRVKFLRLKERLTEIVTTGAKK